MNRRFNNHFAGSPTRNWPSRDGPVTIPNSVLVPSRFGLDPTHGLV